MNKKEIVCYIKAIPFFIRTGNFVPHIFQEVESHDGIVVFTDNSFRESQDCCHGYNEGVSIDSKITTYKCKNCGKIEKSWQRKR